MFLPCSSIPSADWVCHLILGDRSLMVAGSPLSSFGRVLWGVSCCWWQWLRHRMGMSMKANWILTAVHQVTPWIHLLPSFASVLWEFQVQTKLGKGHFPKSLKMCIYQMHSMPAWVCLVNCSANLPPQCRWRKLQSLTESGYDSSQSGHIHSRMATHYWSLTETPQIGSCRLDWEHTCPSMLLFFLLIPVS